MKQFNQHTTSGLTSLRLELRHTLFILLATMTALFSAFYSSAAAASSEITTASENQITPADSAGTATMLLGGSSDILVVKPEDAKIMALTENAFLEIVLEQSIYQVFWDGVRDGTYEYLSIDDCRFFVNYAPHSNSIYAYDWLGLQYLVSARPLN
jgi:hypothetical protein